MLLVWALGEILIPHFPFDYYAQTDLQMDIAALEQGLSVLGTLFGGHVTGGLIDPYFWVKVLFFIFIF